ncbi:MAG TPA: AMP-binding protein [Burkholderiales bacterium]|nr:AMP-binding protein [Burkholderiales bacterium]
MSAVEAGIAGAAAGIARPWLRYYGAVPQSLEYPDKTLYEAIAATARRRPEAVAWDFLGTTSTYGRLLAEIDRCADALAALGLGTGERILISMPTSPQGVIAFYAANKLGAVPAMIHPLSTSPEIAHYLDASGARIALALDAFYGTLAAAAPKRPLETILLARIPDYLPFAKKLGFWLAKGRKIAPVPADPRVHWWSETMAREHGRAPAARRSTIDPAAILFSGGTTGKPKGILLSNRNFIAEGMQAAAWGGLGEDDSILAILPIFHGFGLGVCVNAALMAGGKSILVPVFDPATTGKLLRSKRPSVLVGVPTLFHALAMDPSLEHADLSCLRACFCGADTLPRPVRDRFEQHVAARGGSVRLLEGYGLTESVTAIMAMPKEEYRDGSMGIPFPDMDAKLCVPGTIDEAPAGEEGELCVCGPAVMLGYLDDPEATAAVLRMHADGRTWLHTGDLARRDRDGFFYFVLRLKRMIKSSGFNVYPSQVEAVLCRHPAVMEACVIGVPDPVQIERVKAYVVLKDPSREGETMRQGLIAHCRAELIKWSCPREIEFRRELPRTRVGKTDYRALMQEQAAGARAGAAA